MVEIDDTSQPGESSDDLADAIPEVIEPGTFSLKMWGHGSGGEPVINYVSFTWEGGMEAQWRHDISPDSPGMYQWASAPVWGTATWSNGRDVELTYRSTDYGGLEGEEFLSRAAPVSGDPSTNDGLRDSAQWARLATRLDAFVTSLIED